MSRLDRRLTSSMVSVLCVAACSPEVVVVQIPKSDRDRTIIVALEGGPAEKAYTIDSARVSESPLLAEFSLVDDEVVRISALYYDEAPSALRLAPGEIAAVEGASAWRRLPPQREARQATIRSDRVEPFAPLLELSDWLTNLRLPIPNACNVFSLALWALDEDFFYMAGAAALDATSALLVVAPSRCRPEPGMECAEGAYYRLDADGARRLPLSIPNFAPGRLARTSDHRIVISGIDIPNRTPALVWGTPSEGFVPLPSDGDATELYGLAVGPESPDAVYTVHASCRVHRFAEGVWSTVGSVAIEGSCDDFAGGLVWNGPRDLFNSPLGERPRRIVHFTDGRAVVEAEAPLSPLTSRNWFTGLSIVPDVGAIAGIWASPPVRRDPGTGRWMGFENSPLAAQVYIRDGEGMLVGGGVGGFRQYDRILGLCPASVRGSAYQAAIRFIQRVPGGILIAGIRDPMDVGNGTLAVQAGFITESSP